MDDRWRRRGDAEIRHRFWCTGGRRQRPRDQGLSLDGRELKITGAGLEEVRLATGPHLFGGGTGELLTIAKDGRALVRVRTLVQQPERAEQVDEAKAKSHLLQNARRIAGELVSIRSELDELVWKDVKDRWTTTEASKLLIGFFRGDGSLAGFRGTPEEALNLRQGLAQLRAARERAFSTVSQVSQIDSQQPKSPLCGIWKVTKVRGAGGIAADALELYDPDPVPRRVVFANETGALLTGAGLWLFDVGFEQPDGIDLSAVVRGGTVYRGRYAVNGNEATLRVSPMNSPRPDTADGDPTDGGFVLHLQRRSTE